MHPDNPYRDQPTRKYVTPQLQFRNPYFPRENAVEKQQRHRKLRRFAVGAAGAVLIYVVLFSPFPQVPDPIINGPAPEHMIAVREATTQILNQRRAVIIPGRNALFISALGFQEQLQKRLSNSVSFESLTVVKKGRQLTITAEERAARILFTATGGQMYLLDAHGIVFSLFQLPPGEPLPDLPQYTSQGSDPFALGTEVLPSRLADALLSAYRLLHDRYPDLAMRGFAPYVRTCEPDTDCQPVSSQEFIANVGVSTQIYFTTEYPMESQINNLGLLVQQKLSEITTAKYIDVRFPERAFIKK